MNNQQYTINQVYYGVDQGGNEVGRIYFIEQAPEILYVTFLDIIITTMSDSRLQGIDLEHLKTYCPDKSNELEMEIYKEATYFADSYGYEDSLGVHCYAVNTIYANMYSVGMHIRSNPDLYADGTIHKIAIFAKPPYWGYSVGL